MIQTNDFPINGRIEVATLQAHSPLFGAATLKLTEIRSIRSLSGSGETQLTLDAARYGLAQEVWFETDVDVNGQALEIVADGQVDLYPVGGERGMYIATPDGLRPGGQATTHPSGALLAKVGPSGRPFVVGKQLCRRAARSRKTVVAHRGQPVASCAAGRYAVQIILGQ